MADATTWTRSADVAVVDSPGRAVVLDLSQLRTALPLVMEGPAEAIWRALLEPLTTEAVIEHVAADFGLPAAEVRADVTAFLQVLEDQGLVVSAHSEEVTGAR